MKAHRHADNIGHNIIALQHPKQETLHQFVQRCDQLREAQNVVPVEPHEPELEDQPA